MFIKASIHIARYLSNLLLTIQSTGEVLTVVEFFNGSGYEVNQVVFADGTIWTSDEIRVFVSAITEGDDYLVGDGEDDIINSLGGNDYLYGAVGNDTLNGGEGDDRVYGGEGNDIVYGGTGRDNVYGESGDDIVYGGTGRDNVYGGTGDDILSGGTGNGYLEGGEGNDHYIFNY